MEKKFLVQYLKVILFVLLFGVCSKSCSFNTNISCTEAFETPSSLEKQNTDFFFSNEDQIVFEYFYERADIYLLNSTGALKNLTLNLASSKSPSWSPDGRKLTFVSRKVIDDYDQIFIMDSDGSNTKQLTFNDFHSTQPEWTPDGNSIIYIAYNEGLTNERKLPDPEVFMINSDGTNQVQLTDNVLYEKSLSWSPQTNLIALTAGNPQISRHSLEIYLMNSAGEILDQLTSSENNIGPKWSPDGKLLMFKNYSNNYCSGIIILNVETSHQHCIVIEDETALGGERDPSWSPNGEFILFSSDKDGDHDLYIMEIDGTNVRKITNLPGDELSPEWGK